MYKILLIEDNLKFAEELSKLLVRYDYEVNVVEDFNYIEKQIDEQRPHLILLDVNLPIKNGYYICKDIRKTNNIPVIILTSRNSTSDEVFALEVGADDFVEKPFNSEILVARIERILKRCYEQKEQNDDVITYKDARFLRDKGRIVRENREIILSKNELMLFDYMLKNIGKLSSREDIIKHLWDSEEYIDDNTLTVNVTRLKQKLAEIGIDNVIETRRGQGYILN